MGLLDDQKRRSVSTLQEERAVLVGLITPQQNEAKAREYLDELDFLAETAGAVTVKKFTQKCDAPNRTTFVGKGKLDEIASYIMDIVTYTRQSNLLVNGVSARGSLALYKASQIYAALNGRDYVIPEDVKKEAMAVLPHRIMLSGRSHLGSQGFVRNMLEDVEVPLEH